MDKIEEDIARIKKLITTKFNNDYSIDNKEKEAIEHILSDYKKLQEEFKAVDSECSRLERKEVELERENEKLKKKLLDMLERTKSNQRRNTTIYWRKELKKEGDYRTADNPYGRIHFMEEPCDYKIQVLKELLEESEENWKWA